MSKETKKTSKIEELKKKHGEIFRIKVNHEGKELSCIVRKPNKKDLAASAPFIQSDPLKAGDILMNSCFLEGDPEIKSVDECQVAVAQKMFELFKIASAEVEKL